MTRVLQSGYCKQHALTIEVLILDSADGPVTGPSGIKANKVTELLTTQTEGVRLDTGGNGEKAKTVASVEIHLHALP